MRSGGRLEPPSATRTRSSNAAWPLRRCGSEEHAEEPGSASGGSRECGLELRRRVVDVHQFFETGVFADEPGRHLHEPRAREHVDAAEPLAVGREPLGPSRAHVRRGGPGVARVDEEDRRPRRERLLEDLERSGPCSPASCPSMVRRMIPGAGWWKRKVEWNPSRLMGNGATVICSLAGPFPGARRDGARMSTTEHPEACCRGSAVAARRGCRTSILARSRVAGMGLRHHRTNETLPPGGAHAGWGAPTSYYEVGKDGWTVRQLDVYPHGPTIRYDEDHRVGAHGFLADQPIEPTSIPPSDICSAEEFERAWLQGRYDDQPSLVSHPGIERSTGTATTVDDSGRATYAWRRPRRSRALIWGAFLVWLPLGLLLSAFVHSRVLTAVLAFILTWLAVRLWCGARRRPTQ